MKVTGAGYSNKQPLTDNSKFTISASNVTPSICQRNTYCMFKVIHQVQAQHVLFLFCPMGGFALFCHGALNVFDFGPFGLMGKRAIWHHLGLWKFRNWHFSPFPVTLQETVPLRIKIIITQNGWTDFFFGKMPMSCQSWWGGGSMVLKEPYSLWQKPWHPLFLGGVK